MAMKPVSSQVDFAQLEEETINYWKEDQTFEKSIDSRPADKKWTFLDGPPFITGMPHYGTLLSSIPKDVFGRYWTMKGYRVRRVWGCLLSGLRGPSGTSLPQVSAGSGLDFLVGSLESVG